MKILIFLILIFGLNFIPYSQAVKDNAKYHVVKDTVNYHRVKDWDEHLRYKKFQEIKNEFIKQRQQEDSLNEIRKNIHYPYEQRYKKSLYYNIEMKYFTIIPLPPSLLYDDFWYKG